MHYTLVQQIWKQESYIWRRKYEWHAKKNNPGVHDNIKFSFMSEILIFKLDLWDLLIFCVVSATWKLQQHHSFPCLKGNVKKLTKHTGRVSPGIPSITSVNLGLWILMLVCKAGFSIRSRTSQIIVYWSVSVTPRSLK